MAGVLKYHNGSAWVPVSYPTATSSQAGVIKLADNVTTTTEGEYALDAYQGKVLQDKIDDLSIDYVVERGTTTTTQSTQAGGGTQTWQYVKWNSGIAEAWTEYHYSSLDCSTASGNIYTTSYWQENFPTMFLTVTAKNLIKVAGNASWLMCGVGASTSSHITPRLYLCRAESDSSISAYISMHYMGTWK